MNKRKTKRNIKKPINMYNWGGFAEFMSSEKGQNLMSALSSQGENSQGGNYQGLNNLIGSIENTMNRNELPLNQKIGLPQQRMYSMGGNIAGAVDTGLNLVSQGINNAQIADTVGMKKDINSYGGQEIAANNNDDLMSAFADNTRLNHISRKDLKSGNFGTDFLKSVSASSQGAQAGNSFGPVGGIIGGVLGGISSLTGSLIGRGKAKREARRINNQIDQANAQRLYTLDNQVGNVDTQNDLNMLANYSAYGGPLNTFALGGNMNPSMLKQEDEFSNGVDIIGNGGTHEINPLEGVPMGMDSQGVPNLVEEGEVRHNDYIYSNRLIIDSSLLEKHNLPKKYANKSFAEIAEQLSKESSERPNDPISKKGLETTMNRLKNAQEEVRALKQLDMIKKSNMFSEGGPLDVIPLSNDQLRLNQEHKLNFNLNKPYIQPQIDSDDDNGKGWKHNLRYAPVVASGISAFTDLVGLTNKPDFTSPNMIGKAVDNIRDVEYNPIGNYLSYNPLDRDFYTNKLNAQAGATRRAIINQSGGNRNAAMAGLLASDYNTQSKMGDLFRQAEEYNLAQRERVENFNRGTNQANSQMGLQAAMSNQRADTSKVSGRIAQAQLREQLIGASNAAKSANLNNFIDNLGDVGREEVSKNMINSTNSLYYGRNADGTSYYKDAYKDLSPEDKIQIDNIKKAEDAAIKNKPFFKKKEYTAPMDNGIDDDLKQPLVTSDNSKDNIKIDDSFFKTSTFDNLGSKINNPFSIKTGNSDWRGAKDDYYTTTNGLNFEHFESPEMGVRAGMKLIKNYKKLHKTDTLQKFVDTYVTSEDGNDTKGYLDFLEKELGIKRDSKIDLEDKDTLINLSKAIALKESSTKLDKEELAKIYDKYFKS